MAIEAQHSCILPIIENRRTISGMMESMRLVAYSPDYLGPMIDLHSTAKLGLEKLGAPALRCGRGLPQFLPYVCQPGDTLTVVVGVAKGHLA